MTEQDFIRNNRGSTLCECTMQYSTVGQSLTLKSYSINLYIIFDLTKVLMMAAIYRINF